MVDNFEQIRDLLKFEEDGDCYYVQLLRRQSDDPHTDGKADQIGRASCRERV